MSGHRDGSSCGRMSVGRRERTLVIELAHDAFNWFTIFFVIAIIAAVPIYAYCPPMRICWIRLRS